MKYASFILKLLLFLTILAVLASPALAMLNPSAVYCKTLGYEYVIEETKDGEVGYCKLPDGKKVDAWEFLEGKVAQEHSYCGRMGYELKVVSDKCEKFLLAECAACVLPNGTEVEVTELMGLSFEESKCGDGVCGFPENHQTCPADCPSGGWDAYCEPLKDSICDPDCEDKDPDCVEESVEAANENLGENAGVTSENASSLIETNQTQEKSESAGIGKATENETGNESGIVIVETEKETQSPQPIPSKSIPGFEWMYAIAALIVIFAASRKE